MAKKAPVIIKKYPNRRLYNTETSKYITLDDLAGMVKEDKEFKVVDIKSNDDLTRATLAQIVLSHETMGYDLLPAEVLKQIIKLHDDPLSHAFSNHLLNSFRQWNQYMAQMQNTMLPFTNNDWRKAINDFNQHNQEFFEEFLKHLSRER